MHRVDYNAPDYQSAVHREWEDFINYKDGSYSHARPEVLESWKRSRDANVNPHDIVSVLLSPEELNIKLNNSIGLMNIVRPYMRRLYDVVKGSGSYIVVSDRNGYLLDVIGDKEITYQGRTISKLVPGACRQESVAGTNAIGTAIALQRPIQLWGEEHYCERHKPFSCSGAPFYDENDNLMGVICVTLIKDYAHPHTLGMAMGAADSITREIRLNRALDNLEMISKQRNLIIENMTAGVFLLSPPDRISQVNTNALKMLGLAYEEVIGHNLFDFITIDNNRDLHKIRDFLHTERYNSEVNIVVYTHSMQVRRFNVSVNHVKDSDGNITAVLLRINRPEVIQKLVKRIEGYHAKYEFDDIIGNSTAMVKMKKDCIRAAGTDSNILILGSSGTGKELVAQSIHNASKVADGPFVAVNCAAIPNNLVESELFGYERGAFTGATKEGRPGKFELADGGTIFLDEIGDMPLDIQATLLRVIQTREVVRIGGTAPKPINIRIIAATNQDLESAVEEKAFRSDLYYRLNVFTVYMPSLIERGPGDIKLLADYFVANYNENKGRSIRISSEVYPILQGYGWPGNVRQLENVMERAINLADDDLITADLLPQKLRSEVYVSEPAFTQAVKDTPAQMGSGYVPVAPLPKAKENEKALLIQALTQTNGRVTETAQLLGMNRRTLYRRMDKLGIDPMEFRNKK